MEHLELRMQVTGEEASPVLIADTNESWGAAGAKVSLVVCELENWAAEKGKFPAGLSVTMGLIL